MACKGKTFGLSLRMACLSISIYAVSRGMAEICHVVPRAVWKLELHVIIITSLKLGSLLGAAVM